MNSSRKDYLVNVSISDVASTRREKKELHVVLTKIAKDYHSGGSLLLNGTSAHYFNDLDKAAQFVDTCQTKGKEPLSTYLIQADGRQLTIQDIDKLHSVLRGGFYYKRDGSIE
tara:strand:- start:172 stop:510 length:339 start_codon:yes stop_codon:yes gene_type:complete